MDLGDSICLYGSRHKEIKSASKLNLPPIQAISSGSVEHKINLIAASSMPRDQSYHQILKTSAKLTGLSCHQTMPTVMSAHVADLAKLAFSQTIPRGSIMNSTKCPFCFITPCQQAMWMVIFWRSKESLPRVTPSEIQKTVARGIHHPINGHHVIGGR